MLASVNPYPTIAMLKMQKLCQGAIDLMHTCINACEHVLLLLLQATYLRAAKVNHIGES